MSFDVARRLKLNGNVNGGIDRDSCRDATAESESCRRDCVRAFRQIVESDLAVALEGYIGETMHVWIIRAIDGHTTARGRLTSAI